MYEIFRLHIIASNRGMDNFLLVRKKYFKEDGDVIIKQIRKTISEIEKYK